ncbi:dicarboxylate/amino acid:cation symporter [Erythrobacter litoralis]|uniref:dicarboxylate/amino acid:cation symporter n=1 Tax=Erythrobacter litoralis TaxID=39960 RepID=UPI002434A1CC|nr:dicarboxylate/amino acid:cation symporter [Erythrobacter litoralis]MDG6078997.1 dicarboxylate/amino acid:cation symporter [Erythrobacter litoralis]
MKTWFAIPLWQRVIGALILGIIVGRLWGPDAESIKIIGDIFIAAIKMLVVPLIFFSLVAGVAAIGDLRKLGAVGGRAMLLFVVTGQISVWLGLFLGTVIAPGSGVDTSAIELGSVPEPNETTWRQMVLEIVPQSPVQVMADVNVLPLIVFSVLLGIGILMAKEDGGPVQKVFDSGAVVMQKVTILVMELTPFGVFALMAWVAGTLGFDALIALSKLVALNYAGCLLIIFVMYSAMIKFLAKLPVRDFFRGIIDAMAVSYSTASSNATLPVTLRCAERNLGVSNSVASFVIALGATINMNGTAMYLGLATLFGAQIFGVDRIMDMMRTTTNVSGDAAVATTVAVMTGEIDTGEMISADDV